MNGRMRILVVVYILNGVKSFRKILSVIFNVWIFIKISLNMVRIGIKFSINLICYNNDSRVIYIVNKMKFI